MPASGGSNVTSSRSPARSEPGEAANSSTRQDPRGAGGSEWLRVTLLERGYLARIGGEAIKVYLVLIGLCAGRPGRSVRVSGGWLSRRAGISVVTVGRSLVRLERLGLVEVVEHPPGKAKTYRLLDPTRAERRETFSLDESDEGDRPQTVAALP